MKFKQKQMRYEKGICSICGTTCELNMYMHSNCALREWEWQKVQKAIQEAIKYQEKRK